MTINNTPKNENGKFNLRKLSPRKFVKTVSIIAGIIFLVSVLLLVLFPDPFINTFAKNKITNAFTEAFPEYSILLGEMHYSIWDNRLECDSISLQTKDSTFTSSLNSFSVIGINWIKIIFQNEFDPTTLSNSVTDAQDIVLRFHKTQKELRLGVWQGDEFSTSCFRIWNT